MAGFFHHFINLLYPNLCLVCGDNLLGDEKQICLQCFHGIPRTEYHLQNNNPVEKRFWGKVPVARASSYFFFQKGSAFQQLIHELKYKRNREVGVVLGKLAAVDLVESEFAAVDVLAPVPLHEKKQTQRGYNQSELICDGMALILGKPISSNNLYRVHESSTQTRKSVYERYENTQGIFALKNNEEFAGKHILLVDDVLTTGSTIEACIEALMQTENIKISVFTLALAQ